jgi:hypothetical protein
MARPSKRSKSAAVSKAIEGLAEAALDPLRAGESGQFTAKRASAILVAKKVGFVVPTGTQRQNLLVAFAKRGKVVYGRAFDILKLSRGVDLNDLAAVESNLDAITVYEIKSTKKILPKDFSGFFFAISAAEALVAQSLKQQFKFALVNTVTGDYLELSLNEMFGRARGIYPTWSIMF